jgi:hypothetical protein
MQREPLVAGYPEVVERTMKTFFDTLREKDKRRYAAVEAAKFGPGGLGTSHDTSEFACDCLLDWYRRFGQHLYPQAKSVLIKCDGGGSNSASTYLFKEGLQRVADETGLEIRVAHYPPYCSKYNPIEHRLFCHLTRACQGVVFTSVELVQALMRKARTRAGLSVVVDVVGKVYQTGRRVAAEVKDALSLVRDDTLPKLNYRILPRT